MPSARPLFTLTRLPTLLGVALAVAFLAWIPREAVHTKFNVPDRAGWATNDADSLYHMRRVARVFDEGTPVAGVDPYLNFPHGARIPWPPYYTYVAAALLAPAAPEDPDARRGFIEQGVASLPLGFGVLTSLLAAAAAGLLAGAGAALFAGGYHALCMGSIAYSRIGNGDHHAWVSMLVAALLLVVSAALARGVLDDPRRAARWGAGAGLLAGVLLGSWVASIVYVVELQLVLGWMLFVHARRPRPGLPAFGLAFHLVALAAVLPAVWSSPWREEFPWMVVNLSWFHLVHLGLGALVFVPLLRLQPDRPAYRRYPWIVAGSVAALVAAVLAIDAGPGRGVREGFEWVSRADEFMSGIQESRRLVGPGTGDRGEVLRILGYGVLLLPLAWIAMAIQTGRGRHALLPWTVCVPVLAYQAAAQARFSDALSMPLAVVLGWGFAQVVRGSSRRTLERAALPLALVTSVALQWPTAYPVWQQVTAEGPARPGPRQRRARGVRSMLEWLRTNSPEGGDYCVLANWSQGHNIEWGADRPTVATNFGSYVGDDSFRDPARFLFSEDEEGAEELLARRRARYVLMTSQWPNAVPAMLAATHPERFSRYLSGKPGLPGEIRPAWYRTLGARLMFGGGTYRTPDVASIGFLRMVHASYVRDLKPWLGAIVGDSPSGWIYERVPGAILEAEVEPGTVLSVSFEVDFAEAGERIAFSRSATAGPNGVARLRVPYATVDANGDGRVVGQPRWTLGGIEGPLALSERAVLSGEVVRLP